MPAAAQPRTDHALTFPPFPPAKEGLVAFKEYKERGIMMEPRGSGDDAVEVDGWDIPTIALSNRHDTDACKTKTRRKIEIKKSAAPPLAPGQTRPWWDDWAEQDSKRSGLYLDPRSHILDRMNSATAEFRKGRTGPPQSSNVQSMWDQFKMFAGLMSITPVWNRTDRTNGVDEEDEEDEGDDEGTDEEEFGVTVQANAPQRNKKPTPRPPYDQYGKDPIPVSSDAEVRELLVAEHARKQERALDFLDDSEFETKVFLSSYMRDQGLIWADQNLDNIPRLLELYYKFLLKHRVLADEHKRETYLRGALAVVEQAKKELPLTAKLARSMPDLFSRACTHKWRSLTQPNPFFEDIASDSTQEEPNAKRQKTEDADIGDVEVVASPQVAQERDDETGWGAIPDEPDASYSGPAWGESAGDGTEPVLINPDADGWSIVTDEEAAAAAAAWVIPDLKEIESELGALPETHEPGFVVWSVKRIESMQPPNVNKGPLAQNASDAEKAEDALDRKYAKIILSPWIGWEMAKDDKEKSNPHIKPGSRKPVMLDHDPMSDNITVLCEPSTLDTFVIGMGIGGGWAQLARKEDFVDGKAAGKKKKGKDTKERFWYLDEAQLTLVSYHTAARPKSD